MEIRDRVAVVTGAGVGSGLAIAERLHSEGAFTVLTDLEPSTGTERLCGRRAAFTPADLTRDEDVGGVVEFALRSFGALSILVNNAGGGAGVQPGFPTAAPAEWNRTLDLNLRAPLLMTQLALPHLRAERGSVVNIGSIAGMVEEPYDWPEYAAAKAGLARATSCLGDLDGVRVNCVAPDWLATERALAELADLPTGTRPPIPLPRLCDEVVALVEDDAAAGKVVVLER